MPHLFAHDLYSRLEVILGRSGVQEVALLLNGCELRVALIRDEVEQAVAHALIRNLEHGLPLGAAGIIAELDHVGWNGSELHLELVVLELRRIETDVFLPLAEIIRPVVECRYLRHNYFFSVGPTGGDNSGTGR